MANPMEQESWQSFSSSSDEDDPEFNEIEAEFKKAMDLKDQILNHDGNRDSKRNLEVQLNKMAQALRNFPFFQKYYKANKLDEIPVRMEKYPVDQDWIIKLVNVPRWRVQFEDPTLDFLIVGDHQYNSQYRKMQKELRVIYEIEKLSKTKAFRDEDLDYRLFGIVERKPGEFVRAEMAETLLKKEERTGPYASLEQRNGVIVRYVDYNYAELADLSRFYPTTEYFSRLRYKTLELFLAGTDRYDLFPAYRETLYEIWKVDPNQLFRCKVVDWVGRVGSGIPIVKLYSFKLGFELNKRVLLETVRGLKPPKLPAVGQIRSHVYVTQTDASGMVGVQFDSQQFVFWQEENGVIDIKQLEALRSNGPFTLDKKQVYLALFDGEYEFYRAKILKVPKSLDPKVLVDVDLIDYGSVLQIEVDRLVPCNEISEILAAFPPQALKFHLHNIKGMNPKEVSKLVNATTKCSLYIVKEGSKAAPAEVVLGSKYGETTESFILNNELLKLPGTTPYENQPCFEKVFGRIQCTAITTFGPRLTLWQTDDPGVTITTAQISRGKRILVKVMKPRLGNLGFMTRFPNFLATIQPYFSGPESNCAGNVLEKVEAELATWVKYYIDPNDPPDNILSEGPYYCYYDEELERNVRIRLGFDTQEHTTVPQKVRVLLIDYGYYKEVESKKLMTTSFNSYKHGAQGVNAAIQLTGLGIQIKFRDLEAYLTEQQYFMVHVMRTNEDEYENLTVTGEFYPIYDKKDGEDDSGDSGESDEKKVKYKVGEKLDGKSFSKVKGMKYGMEFESLSLKEKPAVSGS